MFIRVPLDAIEKNPFQTRAEIGDVEDLARSILAMERARPETSGLLQVPPARLWDVEAGMAMPLENLDGAAEVLSLLNGVRSELVVVQLAAGHRRLKAFRQLALAQAINGTSGPYGTFPVELQVLSDEQMADIAWTENAEREDVSPIDEALAIQKAMERFSWTQEQVATRWRLSRPGVANKLRLLGLEEDVQVAIRDGALSERHGRLLLSAMAKSPVVYEGLKAELVPIKRDLPEDVLEKVRELAPKFRGIRGLRRVLDDVRCVACGGPVEPLNGHLYHQWNYNGSEDFYLCTACYRAGTDWTPPTVSSAEIILRNVCDDCKMNLMSVDFPLDEVIGKGNPEIRAGRCSECQHRLDDDETCLDKHCAALKRESWDGYLLSVFLTQLQATFGETAPVVEGYGGDDLTTYSEADLGLIRDGICTPGRCERLQFKRVQREYEQNIRPFPDLPFIYCCNHSSSHRACQRRWTDAQRSADEVEAEKTAKRQERKHHDLASAAEARAFGLVGQALLDGNVTAWHALARRFDYSLSGGKTVDEYAVFCAKTVFGSVTTQIYDWRADDVPDHVEKLVQKRLGELGVKEKEGIDDLVNRLERIEGFVLDEDGIARQDLTEEQLAGNLDNLDQLAMELLQAFHDGRVSEQDDERLNERIQALWAKLENVRAGEDETTEDMTIDDVGMICNTSVDYARRYIQTADLNTLYVALAKEQAGQARTSLVKMLESRIRVLEREAAAS